MLEKVSVLRETMDYGMFKFAPTNRDVNPGHLQRMIEAIRENNLLAEFPIIVDKDMVVLDGQTRLMAAKILHVPVYFIVSPRMRVEQIGPPGGSWRPWSLDDYMKSYLKAGHEEYKLLSDFVTEYNGIKLSDAITLCHYPNGDGPMGLRKKFTKGEYIANNLGFAKKVAAAILDFKPYLPKHYGQRVFVHAVEHLMSDPRYDHDRMMQKMRLVGYRLTPRVSTREYFPDLNSIYNWKVRGEDERVEFTFRKPARKKVTA
jgi:hypothetical protein